MVSVILPVYNTVQYLPRCLDSVRGQTFTDLEILCIDDGSTDGSGEILDAAAKEDSRICVVHFPENRGVPAARNAAIDLARGEWIYFMDSDDWIDPDYIGAMVSQAQMTGQDIVINANYVYEYDDPLKRHPGQHDFVREGQDTYYSPRIVQVGFFPVVWTRLYRRSFLIESGVRFPSLRGGVEDNYFVGLTEVLQEKSYIFHGPAYHYYQREGSLVRTPGNAFRLIQNARLFYDELLARGISLQGIRLLLIMPDIEFHSEEDYQFARQFFQDAQNDIRSNRLFYPPVVLIFMEIVLSSPDLDAYRERCRPNFCVAYIREIEKGIRRGQWTIIRPSAGPNQK